VSIGDAQPESPLMNGVVIASMATLEERPRADAV